MRRILASLLAAVLVIGMATLAHIYRAELQPEHIKALLADNPWAPLIFVAAHIVASVAFFPPRLVLAGVAGFLFGVWAGTVVSMIGAMAGAIACFALARYLHRGFFSLEGKRGLAWLSALKTRLEDGGWRGVALVRLMPVPGTPANYAFGLTGITFGAYAWGTLVGVLPSTIFCAAIGAAGGQALDGSLGFLDLLEPTLIGVAAVAASIALPRLLRLLRGRRPK